MSFENYRFDPTQHQQGLAGVGFEQIEVKPYTTINTALMNPIDDYIKTVIFKKIEDMTNRVDMLSNRLSIVMTPPTSDTRYTPIQIGDLRATDPSALRSNLYEVMDRLNNLQQKLDSISDRIDL